MRNVIPLFQWGSTRMTKIRNSHEGRKWARNLGIRSSTKFHLQNRQNPEIQCRCVRWNFVSPPSDTHLNAASGEIYLLEHDDFKTIEQSCRDVMPHHSQAESPLTHHRPCCKSQCTLWQYVCPRGYRIWPIRLSVRQLISTHELPTKERKKQVHSTSHKHYWFDTPSAKRGLVLQGHNPSQQG